MVRYRATYYYLITFKYPAPLVEVSFPFTNSFWLRASKPLSSSSGLRNCME